MGHLAWFRGEVPDEVRACAAAATGTSSTMFVDDLERLLREAGATDVRRNLTIAIPGGYGRVDLVVTCSSGAIVAIECDRKNIRRKSMLKLVHVRAHTKVIVCREAA